MPSGCVALKYVTKACVAWIADLKSPGTGPLTSATVPILMVRASTPRSVLPPLFAAVALHRASSCDGPPAVPSVAAVPADPWVPAVPAVRSVDWLDVVGAAVGAADVVVVSVDDP